MAVMTAEQALEEAKNLDFVQVWAMFQNIAKEQERIAKEYEEKLNKLREENAREWQERIAKEEERRAKEEERRAKEEERRAKEEERKAKEEERRAKEQEQRAKEQEQRAKEYEEKRAKEEERRAKEEERRAKEHEEREKELQVLEAKNEKLTRETMRSIKRLSKNIGGLEGSVGKIVEHMAAAQLWKKFDVFGYGFTQNSQNKEFIKNGNKIAEVDVFLENGTCVMAVEVKTKLETDDIQEHLERIQIVRDFMDKRNDKRILLGGVAGAVVSDSALHYAHKNGLHVITQSGRSTTLAETPETFTAKKWE